MTALETCAPEEHCELAELLSANDSRLHALIRSTDDEASRAEIETIVVAHAWPFVRKIMSRSHLEDALPAGADADDVSSTVIVRLVQRLRLIPSDRAAAIRNLDAFTAKLAFNAIHDFVRSRFPERTKLKKRVRRVLAEDPRFRVWLSPAGTVCGLTEWTAMPAVARISESWSHADPSQSGDAIASLLEMAGGPLPVSDVILALANAWNVRDEPAKTLDVEQPDHAISYAVRFESRVRMARLWNEIRALPSKQRAALLLNLRDGDGENAIALFAVMEISSLSEIAAAIDLPLATVARIWKRLPLEDLEIASLLGSTRQQVINLRAAARQRLARRMEKL